MSQLPAIILYGTALLAVLKSQRCDEKANPESYAMYITGNKLADIWPTPAIDAPVPKTGYLAALRALLQPALHLQVHELMECIKLKLFA